MKQDLTLNVGTKYNGDGLKKLNTAVATTAKNVGSASRALQSVSAELNQIGGKAGQAAGAIGGLFQAFGQGGIAAVVVTAITGAVGLLVGAFQKAKEAAKDAAEALSKSFDLAVQKTVDRIAKIKAALGFTQKQNAVDQGYAAGQISNAQRQSQLVIRNRYAAQKAGATSDLERARIDAAEKRDLAIDDARWKRSNARAANDNAMTNEQAVRAAQERLAVEVGKQEKALAEQRKLLDNSPLKKEYDLIVIDTPPTAGELQYNALQAATGLIIPLQADIYNLQSLYQITDTARQIQQTNPELKILGFLLTQYDRRSTIARQMQETITEQAAAMGVPYLGAIRAAVAVKEAAALQQSLFEYAPKSNPAADYLAVYDTIAKQEG